MADGDIFRNGLGYYKKLYEWLCESKASMYECTRIAIKALKRDLQKKGDLPIILARNIGERLSQIISVAGENNSVKKLIQEMQPAVVSEIDNWAKKANRDGSVAKLRLPTRRQVTQVDMDEDLCLA